jgi:outer membrane protein insertion porin family
LVYFSLNIKFYNQKYLIILPINFKCYNFINLGGTGEFYFIENNLMRSFNIFIATLILFLSASIFTSKAEAFGVWHKKKPQAPVEQPVQTELPTKEEPVDESFVTKYPPKDLIKSVDIEGNSIIADEKILEAIKSKQGTPYSVDKLKDDLQSIYNMGYFTRNIKALPQKTDQGVVLKIVVQENIPITGFTLDGNTVVEDSEILSIINKNIGMPQNINTLNEMIDDVEETYAAKGFTLARVKTIQDEPDGYVSIKVDEGHIQDIKFAGNIKTKDFVLKRNMMTKSGDIYNEYALADDIKRLFGTRAFSDVKRVVSQSETDPEKYTVKIEVTEKRSGTISLGGGFDTAAGAFGSTGFTDYNFRGMGQQLGIDVLTGSGIIFNNSSILRRASYQAEVRFFDPYFKQSKNSFQAKIFARDYASWQVPLATEKRFGTEIEVMHPIEKYKHLSGGFTVGLEGVKIKEGDLAQSQFDFAKSGVDFSKRANMLVSGTFVSLGPRLVYDTRDSFMAPRQGVYASLGAKEFLHVGGEAGSFGRVEGTIQRYFPVGEKSTVALMAKAGVNPCGNAPLFAQYSLGGIRSVRGFRQTEAGNGNGMMMATAEFRTPIPGLDKITDNSFLNDMRLVSFLDAGRVFQNNIINDVYHYPGYGISAGFGLRIYIPGLGPIKLDYGYPLTTMGGGRSHAGRFLFDVGEMY